MPTFPKELFEPTTPNITQEEELTTEPTWASYGKDGKPIGIPPEMLSDDGAVPPGALRRTVHYDSCCIQQPPNGVEPQPIFDFGDGCLAYLFQRICSRYSEYFLIHGTNEYKYGTSQSKLSETTVIVKICGKQFKILGDYETVVGDPAQPAPMTGNADDYVWIPPQTYPREVHGGTFPPGPATGVNDAGIWHDIHLWHIVPPTRRERCKIVARYRMATIRRTFTRTGEEIGKPVVIYFEPPVYFDIVWDIEGCR